MNIGVVANLKKEEALDSCYNICRWLLKRNHVVYIEQEMQETVRCDLSVRYLEEALTELDFCIVLGGDGTLLNAAKKLALKAVPILGINLGNLGFLTEIEAEDIFAALPGFIEGRYVIDERMMLKVEVKEEDRIVKEFLALNDAVVAKGPFSRLVKLSTYVDGRFVAVYPADGLIVSTPTGSTAYSLAAGGPVVHPNIKVLVMTPICPHSFYDRSMVLDSTSKIRIAVHTGHHDVTLTVDGQEGYQLQKGQEVLVSVADFVVKLMRQPRWDFFGTLRTKLTEGY